MSMDEDDPDDGLDGPEESHFDGTGDPAEAGEMDGSQSGPWSEWEGPRRLAPETSLRARVLMLGLFALIWNGFSGTMFWFALRDGVWLGVAFLSLFVLVGLGILVGFMHQFLSLFNPVVELALESGAVPAGGDLTLAWETKGRTGSVREFRIEVTATEKATYTRGTSTVTETNVLVRLPAIRTRDQTAMAFGTASVTIPARAMHSFPAGRNAIEWALEVRGEIPFWPDVSERYPFFVKPRGR